MWCDLVPPNELSYAGWPAFHVSEFAVLSDGREVTLLDDRGWGSWTIGLPPEEYLSQFTVRDIEREVYNVLLPDYADATNPLPPDLAEVEAIGGAQDWEMLAQRLGNLGIATTPALLRSVPRRVDISDRLKAHLRDGER
jgi:hypothetical protein